MRRTASAWLLGTGLVVVAGLLSGITPPGDSLYEPILIRGDAQDTVSSRTLIASVSDSSFADEIIADGGDWQAVGNWLVVEVVASAPQTEEDARIPLATLLVDGRVFQASERPPETLLDAPLHVGTDTVGVLVFDLPEGLRSGTAELRLSSRYSTPELDDVIAIPLPLDEASAVASIELDEPRVGAP